MVTSNGQRSARIAGLVGGYCAAVDAWQAVLGERVSA